MKKTLLYYMVCLVGAVSLFACSDWFDVNPKTDVFLIPRQVFKARLPAFISR